jgi:molybdate transport system substrate-binding protein
MISLSFPIRQWRSRYQIFLALCCCAGTLHAEDLQISAAISLKESLEALTPVFQAAHPGVRLYLNFGASGSLARQVEAGAPVDVFFSASSEVMARLEGKGLLTAGTPTALLGNEIVLVVNPALAQDIRGFSDLSKVGRLGLGNPAFVPAGQYARQTLEALGLWAALKDRMVLGGDARQVLTYAARHEVDAALVFATDARTLEPHQLVLVATAPAGSHEAIGYEVAAIKASTHPQLAALYVNFLHSPQAAAEFTRHGFTLNPPKKN